MTRRPPLSTILLVAADLAATMAALFGAAVALAATITFHVSPHIGAAALWTATDDGLALSLLHTFTPCLCSRCLAAAACRHRRTTTPTPPRTAQGAPHVHHDG